MQLLIKATLDWKRTTLFTSHHLNCLKQSRFQVPFSSRTSLPLESQAITGKKKPSGVNKKQDSRRERQRLRWLCSKEGLWWEKAENFAFQKAADRGSTFSSRTDQNFPALDTEIERDGGEDGGGFWNGTPAFSSPGVFRRRAPASRRMLARLPASPAN